MVLFNLTPHVIILERFNNVKKYREKKVKAEYIVIQRVWFEIVML